MIARWTLLVSNCHALPQHGGLLMTWGLMQSWALLTCLHEQRSMPNGYLLVMLLVTPQCPWQILNVSDDMQAAGIIYPSGLASRTPR